MTMAQTRNKFSRKTVAIAIASSVAMGGITIPQAGAVTGAEGVTTVASAEAGVISPTSPFPEVKETMTDRTYKLADAESGSKTALRVLASPTDIKNGEIRLPGLFAGVPDENIKGIDGFYVGEGDVYTDGWIDEEKPVETLVRGKDYRQVKNGVVRGVKSVRVEENGDFVISLLPGTKRIHGNIHIKLFDDDYIDYAELDVFPGVGTREPLRLNFVKKNPDGTYSGELEKQDLSYLVPDEYTGSVGYDNYNIYGFPLLAQEQGVDVEPHNFFGTNGLHEGGVVARIPGQGVWEIDNNAGTISFTPEANFEGTPILPRIGVVDPYNLVNLVSIPRGQSEKGYDTAALPDEMAQYTFIDMQYVMPEEYREQAEKDRDFNPNTPPPAEDLHVTDVKKDGKGDYVVTRSDGKTWTIKLKDIRDAIKTLEDKKSPTKEEFDKVKTDLDKILKEIEDLKAKDDALQKEIDKLKGDVKDINDRLNTIEKELERLDGQDIEEVRDNGDGTYTLIRNNGDEVKGNIDTSGSVTDIKTDGKGNLVITIDGKDKKVPLEQVKVVEEKAGTSEHTVTITTPDGKSVTFNVFDTYVTNVEKQPDGNYKVTRNDGESWIINLKDIRDKIAALEAKESPSKEDFDNLKKEVDDLKKQVDDLQAADKKLEGDITNIKTEINNLDNRITKIEARLTVVEGDTAALTKCVAGAGMAGIPALLSIPLMVMTQLNIPGIKDLNTQVQKQIGMYNPDLARAWERNGGVLQAGAVLAGLAGMIGGIAYLAKQCDPMMQSDAAKETDLGKLSSKLEKKDLGSSKKDAGATQPDKQEVPAAGAPADADAEAPAEGAVEGAAEAAEPATAPSEDLVAAQ